MFAVLSRILGSNTPPVPSSSNLRPRIQSLYSFDHKNASWTERKRAAISPSDYISKFSLATWNIDFSSPLPILRLKSALDYLEQLLSPLLNSDNDNPPPPTIILLQELHKSCFPTLLSNKFIRAVYDVSDISPVSWNKDSSYGTVTLVPKPLSQYVSFIFRTPFPSTIMGRDALYVDFSFPGPSPHDDGERNTTKIRVGNTHLESLPGHGDKARTQQLASISEFLSCSPLDCGVVGGDMNAISPSDSTLVEDVGLLDAWTSSVEMENAADEADGHTWGYQPPTVFPPNRLDKILFVGELRVDDIERIGVGLKHANADASDDNAWVSDHYGLLAKFTII
ncbi:Endonuclease/exonuclease/phosphatase [Abortiporus biennis]|nr:Endonuclease/exonuclease/phosphatase [Abortiporus biennis]